MDHSRSGLIALSAATILAACGCTSSLARDSTSGTSSSSGTSSFDSTGVGSGSTSSNSATYNVTVTDATLDASLQALDALLPPDPGLPSASSVCATLNANLASSAFASPSTTDPSIDNIATITADPASSNPDTARIQAALNGCPSGQSVRLVTSGSNDAFLAGALILPTGVTLWLDTGVTLYASRNPADFTASGLVSGDECGNASSTTTGKACHAFITVASGASGSGVAGDGTIDGRGGSAITSGPKAGVMTWWDVALLNKVSGYAQNCPNLLDLTHGGSNFVLSRIALLNSPHFHVKVNSYSGFTAWGVQLLTPSLAYSVANYACTSFPSTTSAATSPGTCYSPDYTKNTDGIDPGGSRNVTIAYSYINVGDDNVAVTASNTSNCIDTVNGYCASSNTLIAHNHFYYGHGMSVGSGTQGGVTGLYVWDLSIDGEDSSNGAGLRIKTYQGAAGEVTATYAKVCMQREKQPIVIDPFYSSATSTTSYQPYIHDVHYVDIHSVKLPGSKYPASTNWNDVLNGVNASNLLTNVTLDNVYFDKAPAWGSSSKASFTGSPNYASFIIGPASTSFPIPTTGSSVSVSGSTDGTATSGNALDCSAAFPAFSTVNSKAPI